MGDQAQVPSGQALSNLYPTPSSADFTSPYPPSQHPPQPQQGQYNPSATTAPIGGIPDAARGAMWQQFEQSVKSGTAMTPQQVAAQLGAGGLGRASVSLSHPSRSTTARRLPYLHRAIVLLSHRSPRPSRADCARAVP